MLCTKYINLFILFHFMEKDWDAYDDEKVYKLVNLFQANEDSYARLLWEDEEKGKESWKKSKLGEYKLDHLYRERKNKTQTGEASTPKST
jgi:hypothetical protein